MNRMWAYAASPDTSWLMSWRCSGFRSVSSWALATRGGAMLAAPTAIATRRQISRHDMGFLPAGHRRPGPAPATSLSCDPLALRIQNLRDLVAGGLQMGSGLSVSRASE